MHPPSGVCSYALRACDGEDGIGKALKQRLAPYHERLAVTLARHAKARHRHVYCTSCRLQTQVCVSIVFT